eukprot:3796169-Pyramimonas_sp.AAC.1
MLRHPSSEESVPIAPPPRLRSAVRARPRCFFLPWLVPPALWGRGPRGPEAPGPQRPRGARTESRGAERTRARRRRAPAAD